MKSFFVIKGKTSRDHKWFDQQGKSIPLYGDTDLPYVKTPAEDAVNVTFQLDRITEVPRIDLGFRVEICENEEQVAYYAAHQNLTGEALLAALALIKDVQLSCEKSDQVLSSCKYRHWH